jgi:hypothetical protein
MADRDRIRYARSGELHDGRAGAHPSRISLDPLSRQ